MAKRLNLVGMTFGRLTFLQQAPDYICPNGKHRTQSVWLCVCGKTIVASNTNVARGNTRSCGCFMLDRVRAVLTKHGHNRVEHRTRTYRIWAGMKSRCTNPNNHKWADYGGRGIRVCDRWQDSFENFLADMGECPDGKCIDRLNNDGNYELGNCAWNTQKEQQRNKRNTRVFTVRGITDTLPALCERFGLSYDMVDQRMRVLKWPIEVALTQPRYQHRPIV